MEITAQQFVSTNREKGSFVTILKYFPYNSEKKVDKEGDLFCILSIQGDPSLPAERVSKFVWDGIVDGYMYSPSKTTNESLKDAISEGVRKLKDLMRNDKTLEQMGVNINFLIVAQKKEGLYVGNFGENDVLVFKDGRLVNIIDILKKNKANTAGVALKEHDVLIAGTKSVLEENLSTLSALSSKKDIVKYLDGLGNDLVETQALIYFSSMQKQQPEEEIRPAITVSALRNHVPVDTVTTKKKADFKWVIKYWNTVKLWFEKVFKWIKEKTTRAFVRVQPFFEKIFGKVKEKIGNKKWFKKVASKVSEVRINTNVPIAKGIRIDGYRDRDVRRKRVRLVLLVVVIIVLVAFGINFTIKARQASQIHSNATDVFVNVDTLITKAESEIGTDKSSAEVSVYQAKNLLSGLTSTLNEKDGARKAELELAIQNLEDEIYKIVGVSDADGKVSTFLDARLTFGDGSNPTDIDIRKDTSGNEYLLVTDKGLHAVFQVNIYDKSSERIPDTDGLLVDPEYVSMGNSGIFVYDERVGVLKASFSDDGSVESFVALSGLDRDSIDSRDIGEFIILTESDNVYLLARDENAILKSAFSYGNRYGLYYTYITNDSFANANDILADLSLYVLSSDAPELIRYNYSYVEQKQVEAPLSVGGFDGSYGNLSKGFTLDSLTYGLYLFDSEGKRFFKFEKPMESVDESLHPNEIVLENQYVYRGSRTDVWNNVKDFVVDYSESSMYILDGSVIWKVAL